MNKRINRRRLLKRTSLLLATGVHGAAAVAKPLAANEKLNVGVIGVGNRGVDNIAGVISENIAALCDVDQRHLDEMASRFPRAKTYRDLRRAIEQQNLDAVVICTPDHTHAVAAAAALRRKLHVYCERPLAHDLAELRGLTRLAKEAGVATQMGNQHHSSHGYEQAVETIRSGALGAIRSAHCWTTRPNWPQGIARPRGKLVVPSHLDWDLWLGPAPQRPYHSGYHPMNWRGFWDFGTGALGDFGPHILDPVVTGLQLSVPDKVTAKTSPVNAETAPESSIVRFQFPARKQRPAVQVTWYDGQHQPPSEITGIDRLPPDGAIVLGERGKLFIPPLGRMPTLLPVDVGERPDLPQATPSPKFNHWQHWLNACKGGEPANSHFAVAAVLTEICLLGNVAIRTGQPVEWDAKAMRAKGLPEADSFLRREYRTGWDRP